MDADLAALLADRRWRLDNLYWIVDASGRRVRFRLNAAQEALYRDLHARNVILKARQLGITTFVQILMLDACLFGANVRAGTIAHTLEDAQAIFRDKVKYPYDNLPSALRARLPAVEDSARTLTFANNSSLRVGTSFRGGTYQYLHVSELGHVAARRPDRAREIRTGALNAVPPGGVVFVESTAEGREGAFFDLCKAAQDAQRAGRELTPLDFRFHFFPWWRDPRYRLAPGDVDRGRVTVGAGDAAYFGKLADAGIALDDGQRAWYAAMRRTQGEDMLKEYPSTPEEAFHAAIEGAYYAREMARARAEGRITSVPHAAATPVDTFWDLGVDDETVIWFHQRVGRENRFVDCYANSGEGLAHYARVLQEKAARGDWVYGRHYLPHDVAQTSLSTGRSRLATLKELGVRPVTVVPRAGNVADGIQAARNLFPTCWFDEGRCEKGLAALDAYRREWDESLGTWKDRPLHNWASHAADAFRTFAEGWRERAGAPPLASHAVRAFDVYEFGAGAGER
jgi:hypothetical protein